MDEGFLPAFLSLASLGFSLCLPFLGTRREGSSEYENFGFGASERLLQQENCIMELTASKPYLVPAKYNLHNFMAYLGA